MDPSTGPPSKRKALQELFRPSKRAHTPGDSSFSSDLVPEDQSTAGATEPASTLDNSNPKSSSDQSNYPNNAITDSSILVPIVTSGDPTEPPNKRKALKELFRADKRTRRAHTAGSDAILDDGSAVGPAELLPSVDSSESGQHNTSSHSGGSPAPIMVVAPTQPGSAHSTKAPDAKTAAEMAWRAFKATLPIVEKVSVVFPPLQSAVGGLIGVIAQLDVSRKNDVGDLL